MEDTKKTAVDAKAKAAAEEVKAAGAEDNAKPGAPKRKKKKKEPKKPGVIAEILIFARGAKKPFTAAEVLAYLVGKFPERTEKAMKSTVNIQLGANKRPSRIEKEKGVEFAIEIKEGVRYFNLISDVQGK